LRNRRTGVSIRAGMSNPSPRIRLRSYRSYVFLVLVGCTVNGKPLGPQFSSSTSSSSSSSSSSGTEHTDDRVPPGQSDPETQARHRAAREREAEMERKSRERDASVERQFAQNQAERAARDKQREQEATARAEHEAFCKTVELAKDASDRDNEDRRAWKEIASCRGFEPFTFWHLEEQAKASQVWHLAATMRCYEDAGGDLPALKRESLTSSYHLTAYAFCGHDGRQLDRSKLEAELAANKNVTPRVKAWILERFTTTKVWLDGHEAAYKALAKESPAVANVLAAGQAAFADWTDAFAANKAVFDRIIDVERRGDGSRKALAGCAAKLRPAFFELIAKHKLQTEDDYRAMVASSYASRLVDALAFCEEIDGDETTAGLLRARLDVKRGPRRAAAGAALATIIDERADNPKFSSSPHLFVPRNSRPDGSHFQLKGDLSRGPLRGGIVAKVEPKGERVTITFKQTSWTETTYNCKNTDRVGRVNSDGTIYWQQDCKPKGKEKVTHTERAVMMPAAYANGIKPGQFLLTLRKWNEHEHYNDNEPLWGALPMFVYTDTNKKKLLSVLGQSL
jgi:hypothetical protein